MKMDIAFRITEQDDGLRIDCKYGEDNGGAFAPSWNHFADVADMEDVTQAVADEVQYKWDEGKEDEDEDS